MLTPILEIGVISPSRKSASSEISESEDPKKKLLEKEKEYSDLFANPYTAAERGFIDEVIEPRETRKKLIKSFAMLENKVQKRPRRKHGNIPL